MKRLIAAAAMLTLLSASPAMAGYWSWGFNYLGPSTSTNNGCYYSSGAVCSGWNYWYDEYVDKRGGGRVLAGFENSSTIRGWWLDGAVIAYLTPSDVSMGGYLRAQVTYWYGDASYLFVDASA